MFDIAKLRLTETEKLYSRTPTDGDIDFTADAQLYKAVGGLVDWIREVGKDEEQAFIMECEDVCEWIADMLQESLEQAKIAPHEGASVER